MNVPLRKIEKPVLPQADRPGQATTPQSPPSTVESPAPPTPAPRIIDRLAAPMLAIAGLATIAWIVLLGWGLVWLLAHVLF